MSIPKKDALDGTLNVKQIILKQIKPHIPGLIIVLFMMLAIAGLEASAPWPFKLLIDNVLGDEKFNPHSLLGRIFSIFPNQQSFGIFVVFIFFMINILLSLFDYLKAITIKKTVKQIIFNFANDAFRNMELFDIAFLRTKDTGDYIYRLSYDVEAIGQLIEEGIMPVITSTLYLIFTAVIMLTISVKLTLLALAVLPVLAGGLYYFNKRIIKLTKKSEYWNSALFTFVAQVLNQLKIVQAFSQEKREQAHFNRRIDTSLTGEYKLFHVNFLLALVVGIIIAMSYSIIIGMGINYFFAGEISTGLLIVFIFYLDNLITPVLSIIEGSASFKESYIKISRIHEFYSSKGHTNDSGKLTNIVDTTIKFEHVSLFTDENEPILNDISFTIEQGKTTVLVGVSGSGKTSIISLIPRFFGQPSSGKIYLGDYELNQYAVETLRENISYVPQENELFNDTIGNIISYSNQNADMEEVKRAAKLAVADEFIEDRKLGYDFRVGDGGNFLSGGQRQRVMLARAFMKKARIYIFDEPLSSLDIQTRATTWEHLQKFSKGKTVIIVSNILDVITSADHVLVVNKGKIVHAGQHRDLLRHSELYKLILRTD